MTLDVDIERPLGSIRLQASFTAPPGVTAIFGRSGSGKTSVINCIAGLLRPERGRIVVDGTTLFDSTQGIDLPTHRRRLGYVFQEARLFPHLKVRQNLLYGRWFSGKHGAGSLDAVTDLLGIGHLLDRRPGALSGGERQRVAIGRALLAEPRLLLLDEPLASLDAARKVEILPYLERLRDEMKVPIVYVSHSVDEVTRLADTLVTMTAGRVVAAGPIGEIMARPGQDDDLGGALLSCRVVGPLPEDGLTLVSHPAGELRVTGELPVGASVRLRIDAEDVALVVGSSPLTGLSIRNQLRGRVVAITPAGASADVMLDVGGDPMRARVTAAAVRDLGLVPGTPVMALIKSVALHRPT
ncbi:MAG: molybdenum ABC transporter ATP-binding protein [Geminicoccaceae bacterium]